MQKHLLPVAVSCMAVSLITFMVRGGAHEVAAFGLSTLLAGYLSYLEHLRTETADAIEEEIKTLRNQIANISVAIGWEHNK